MHAWSGSVLGRPGGSVRGWMGSAVYKVGVLCDGTDTFVNNRFVLVPLGNTMVEVRD